MKVFVGESEADVPMSKGTSVWRGVRRKDELGGPGCVERSGECLGFPSESYKGDALTKS